MIPHAMLVYALPVEAMSGFALLLARPKYFANTSQPFRTTSNPPFCVQRWVNSHACSRRGKSIPARSRMSVAFVAVRQPPALSGGGKESAAERERDANKM